MANSSVKAPLAHNDSSCCCCCCCSTITASAVAAADAKSNVTGPLNDLKKALEGEDVAAIKSATETLAHASQSLGAALYANTQGADGAGEAGGGQSSATDGSHGSSGSSDSADDDVVDAEIVDEGEHK